MILPSNLDPQTFSNTNKDLCAISNVYQLLGLVSVSRATFPGVSHRGALITLKERK